MPELQSAVKDLKDSKSDVSPVATASASDNRQTSAIAIQLDEAKSQVAQPREECEMLEKLINWLIQEFSADEEDLNQQVDRVPYRLLWLYYRRGTLVFLEDHLSKQNMGAIVI